jgi:hypothetical protein
MREVDGLQNFDLMATNPNINLLEAGFQSFFMGTKELVGRPRPLDINNETEGSNRARSRQQ